MRNRLWIWIVLLGNVLMSPAVGSDDVSPEVWQRATSLPDAIGFAGMLAGTSRGKLIAAGGANFPQAPPWEGGRKVWSDQVFVLDSLQGRSRTASTRLTRPLGYGVSVTHDNSVIVAGGESPTATGSEARREVFAIRWTGEDVALTSLPPLPAPVMNACGAMLGSRLYVAGGASSPTVATKSFWSLDLAAPPERQAWTEHPAWDGPPRMLAVAAVANGSFYMLSGAELNAGSDGKPVRRFLRDAHCFDPNHGWSRIADLPRSSVAAPGPAPVVNGRILVLGGDDGEQFLNPPQDHTGFQSGILSYDPGTDRWMDAGKIPTPRVTVPLVEWNDKWVLISGEKHPGVRSPEVWTFSPMTKAH